MRLAILTKKKAGLTLMKELPIGIIDSGFGGLTVVKQSLKQLPNESIIYLGDSARCPYGPRPLSQVKEFIWQMTNFLLEKGIKMLVIACNTGTAAALEEIRATLSIPVIGVIHPGSRAAIKETQNQRIGVIGTQGTINSLLYEQVILEKANHLSVKSVAAPEFVSIVEENRMDDAKTPDIVKTQLQSLIDEEVDTLVLGCTHYPIIRDVIQMAMGDSVSLIDSGVETINEVSTLLDYFNLSRSAQEALECPATMDIYTTGEADRFETVAKTWLQNEQLVVKTCRIEEDNIVENINRNA
ncbi:glutamate racemase [Tuanshanicoccus lijuaniae]|uniref:glutamate racemase n=1 Tax=Aerococcaceae bacterium zg-1292 TaxID=2774330 RepID=UPI004063F3BA